MRAFAPFWWLKPVLGKPVETGCGSCGSFDHVLKHVARLKREDKRITHKGVSQTLQDKRRPRRDREPPRQPKRLPPLLRPPRSQMLRRGPRFRKAGELLSSHFVLMRARMPAFRQNHHA